jgi:hypothetical protein
MNIKTVQHETQLEDTCSPFFVLSELATFHHFKTMRYQTICESTYVSIIEHKLHASVDVTQRTNEPSLITKIQMNCGRPSHCRGSGRGYSEGTCLPQSDVPDSLGDLGIVGETIILKWI